MRLVFALFLFVTTATLARTQPPPKAIDTTPLPRFGIPVRLKSYPQDTEEAQLASAVEAVEGDTAHFSRTCSTRIRRTRGATGRQYEALVEIELSRQRDFQIRNPERFQPEDRLPTDRAKFNALIVERSRERAFRQLVREVNDKLLNDPLSLKDLKKIMRDGTFADEPGGARASHPDVKDRALYLKKIGDRWFLESRQEDTPAKGPEEKKQ